MITGAGGSCSANGVSDFTQPSQLIKRNGSRRHRPQGVESTIIGRSRKRKICSVRFSTGFTRTIHRFSTAPFETGVAAGLKSRMQVYAKMSRVLSFFAVYLCLALAGQAYAADATLFRLFLLDGSVIVSYGEFARVDDKVIFSMPVGGRPDEPRLQVASVRAA